MEDLHRRLVVTSRAQDRLKAALPGSGSHPAHELRLTSFKGIAIPVGFWTVVAVAAARPNVGSQCDWHQVIWFSIAQWWPWGVVGAGHCADRSSAPIFLATARYEQLKSHCRAAPGVIQPRP